MKNQKTHSDTLHKKIWPLWLGFILISLNLRLIFASVGPILKNLDLSFTSTLLATTLPPILLGIFSVAGVKLRRLYGEERTLFIALILLTLGCGLRWFGEGYFLVGTTVGSMGIAVMNVVMPALIRKRFKPQQLGFVMGLYALMLGLGAVLGASGAFPLYQLMGANITTAFNALGLWAIPALIAAMIWLPQLTVKNMNPSPTATNQINPINVYRNKTAWSITLFFGLQALNLYVFLAWLPTMLVDRGMTPANAALIFSLSQLSLMLGGFMMPFLAAKMPDQRFYIAVTVLSCLIGTLGLMYAPLFSALIWCLLLGFGQGAGPALGALLFVARSSNIDTATRISAMAQTVGYLIAGIGPLLVGYSYKISGNWHVAILFLSIILIIELIVSLPAGKKIKI